MIAHLFSNIFFFLNGALLNTFIDQGMDLGLFIYSIGSKVIILQDKNVNVYISNYS